VADTYSTWLAMTVSVLLSSRRIPPVTTFSYAKAFTSDPGNRFADRDVRAAVRVDFPWST
jgi:hypothetical protein